MRSILCQSIVLFASLRQSQRLQLERPVEGCTCICRHSVEVVVRSILCQSIVLFASLRQSQRLQLASPVGGYVCICRHSVEVVVRSILCQSIVLFASLRQSQRLQLERPVGGCACICRHSVEVVVRSILCQSIVLFASLRQSQRLQLASPVGVGLDGRSFRVRQDLRIRQFVCVGELHDSGRPRCGHGSCECRDAEKQGCRIGRGSGNFRAALYYCTPRPKLSTCRSTALPKLRLRLHRRLATCRRTLAAK